MRKGKRCTGTHIFIRWSKISGSLAVIKDFSIESKSYTMSITITIRSFQFNHTNTSPVIRTIIKPIRWNAAQYRHGQPYPIKQFQRIFYVDFLLHLNQHFRFARIKITLTAFTWQQATQWTIIGGGNKIPHTFFTPRFVFPINFQSKIHKLNSAVHNQGKFFSIMM